MREAAESEAMTGELLAWYDRHARALPWRAPPGAPAADPYRVWLSEVMLQQTTVAAVRPYFERFVARWPDVQTLAAAEDGEVMAAWAGLGYYARARNMLACARAVAELGAFPDTREGLIALPGIGPYTAAAIASIAFGRPETVVDGNVERVMARVHAVEAPLPGARGELTRLAARLTPEARPGDYAQAVMDLGATICTPRAPACGICPWMARCEGRKRDIAASLPRKAPKVERPLRRATFWIARRGGEWLTERRPPRGLLGGTLGWPTGDWAEAAGGEAPLAAPWREAGEVRHVFTHFELRARVLAAEAPSCAAPDRGAFAPLDPAHLTTLMRRAHALAQAALDG